MSIDQRTAIDNNTLRHNATYKICMQLMYIDKRTATHCNTQHTAKHMKCSAFVLATVYVRIIIETNFHSESQASPKPSF